MKTVLTLFFLFSLSLASIPVVAQDDATTNAKLQFSSMFMGTKNAFADLKGDLLLEDENFTYYKSEYGLGNRAFTVLHSKKDSTEWYCYVEFSMETDLTELPAVQSGAFGVLNMMVSGGKITGQENTEGDIIRTDLYASVTNAWLGELVSNQSKKTFHILLKNTDW